MLFSAFHDCEKVIVTLELILVSRGSLAAELCRIREVKVFYCFDFGFRFLRLRCKQRLLVLHYALDIAKLGN